MVIQYNTVFNLGEDFRTDNTADHFSTFIQPQRLHYDPITEPVQSSTGLYF